VALSARAAEVRPAGALALLGDVALGHFVGSGLVVRWRWRRCQKNGSRLMLCEWCDG
jgi:hypothetical protein